jgi:hypothetical protein
MSRVIECMWSPTGHAYEVEGRCTCRIAAPPGIALYGGELAALEHERDAVVAAVLACPYYDPPDPPPQYAEMLASATAKLAALRGAP